VRRCRMLQGERSEHKGEEGGRRCVAAACFGASEASTKEKKEVDGAPLPCALGRAPLGSLCAACRQLFWRSLACEMRTHGESVGKRLQPLDRGQT
jgi:hypothetical protein